MGSKPTRLTIVCKSSLICLASLSCLLLTSVAALPSSAPAWLRGQSIALNYTEDRDFEPVEGGSGRAHSDTVTSHTDVYISEQGRIFAKARRNVSVGGRKHTLSKQFDITNGPDVASSDSDWKFEGDALYGLLKLGAGAMGGVKRITVTFDRSAQNCSVSVAYARASGASQMIITGWSHDDYYLRRDEVKSADCSLSAGNVFAR